MEFVPQGGSKGANVGAPPPTPVIFGWFEVGRTSDPQLFSRPSACFKDKLAQGTKTELTGDPGQYDPYAFDDTLRLGYNKNRKPFDSTQYRDLHMNIGELGYTAPGPGYYPTHANYASGKAYKKQSAGRATFRSTSQQRPSAKSFVPSPDRYKPNMNSIYPNQRDSGANMRSSTNRFAPVSFGGSKSMTPRKIGPGSYRGAEQNLTLFTEAQRSTSRASKIQPGFGSTSAQRALPLNAPRGGPSPGEHQPPVGGYSRTPRGGSRTPRTPRTPRAGSDGGSAAGTPRRTLRGIEAAFADRISYAWQAPATAPAQQAGQVRQFL